MGMATKYLFPIVLLVAVVGLGAGSKPPSGFANILKPSGGGLNKEKLSHLHFYFHDIVSGRNPTAVQVARAQMTNSSRTLFGVVVVTDDPLTSSPEINSTMVGRAQGMYASASQTETGLLMVMNFAFSQGKYKGSTLSVLGRNTVMSAVRELSIVGGSGVFRFARGYAQARTHSYGFTTGDAVVEYNVYVFHY